MFCSRTALAGPSDQPDDKDTIYGVIVTGGTSVVNATLDDIDDNYNTTGEVSINDTAYDVAESGKIVTNYVSENKWSSSVSDGVSKIEALSKTNGNTVKFILDDNNEIVSAYVTEYAITKVTAGEPAPRFP